MQVSTVNLLEQRRLPAFSFDPRMKFKSHDLNALVRELEEMLPGVLPTGVKAVVDCANFELKVMTDPLKLKTALLNLIENAGDALSPGGSLAVSTSRIGFEGTFDGKSPYGAGGCALVSISDTGTGMDEMIKDKMFDPFFTTKPGKIGLGCTLAQRIVDCHNGRISVDSGTQRGTRIMIYLPLLKNDHTREVPIPLPSFFPAGVARLRR
jgi:two-component system cell cycle sensor histidine kinase/response regulator CckA